MKKNILSTQPVANIPMVDLISQYQRLKSEIDPAIQEVLDSAHYIKGPIVTAFEKELADYMGCKYVIACANGTDALQIALMALDLKPGDEVIVPAFTYVATAEVIALLGLTPVMVDVDSNDFCVTCEMIEAAITPKTKAVVPVHLFGQGSEMEAIKALCQTKDLYLVEDNAQAIGSDFFFSDGHQHKLGTIGDIGTTSFFPSKNLGCFGDGGALFTNDDNLAQKIRMIANHGQSKTYYHDLVGCNSRLDAIQAAVLRVKLRHLDDFAARRQAVAAYYDQAFTKVDWLEIPYRNANSTHVFHQYTLKLKNGQRDQLRTHLKALGIAHNVYYPVPLYKQKAFAGTQKTDLRLSVTEAMCSSVISLPIHTEMSGEVLAYIVEGVMRF